MKRRYRYGPSRQYVNGQMDRNIEAWIVKWFQYISGKKSASSWGEKGCQAYPEAPSLSATKYTKYCCLGQVSGGVP
jgi:hypothetical protein